MQPITVVITILAYFAVLLLIGRLASRGAGGSTFFTGDRKAPWLMVAIATAGAAISGVTFISVPGMVQAKGYAYLQMALGFVVGYAAIGFVLVPLFYRRGLVSIYGYLEQRFGSRSYSTGAWIFIISKLLGAAVRFFVVCVVVQLLVCDPLGIPFELNVAVTLAFVWLYSARGGVKSVIWTDVLKSFCLISSVVLCIWFIARNLGMDAPAIFGAVAAHDSSRVFFFDNPMEAGYFWKQFIAGVFMAIATNGLDQDMMQRTLACSDWKASRKNMITGGIIQVFVIGLFLVLGTLLTIYMERTGMEQPAKSDELFGAVASSPEMPVVVGVLFILGLISAAYSAVGSALTSLTTSMTLDILRQGEAGQKKRDHVRFIVHIAMTVAMGLVIIAFYHLSDDDAISAVYTLASYTYGPILGLFAFGLATSRKVRDKAVPWICIVAPAASWVVQWALGESFGYIVGFELLLVNAAITALGLLAATSPRRSARRSEQLSLNRT